MKPAPPDAEIDFSEIPEASEEWLTQARHERAARLGHLTRPRRNKVAIALRLDPDLLAVIKELARARHVKYQTLMQELLATEVVRTVEAEAAQKVAS